MTTRNPGVGQGIGEKISGRLADEVQNLVSAAVERLVSAAADRMGAATERLVDYAANGGGPGVVAAATGARKLADGSSPLKAGLSAGLAGAKEKLKEAVGKAGAGKGKIKVTNIVESIDVGVPVRVAYDQWTRYEDFSSFMKKVENVDRASDEKTTWKAQVFWSHRTWEATVVEQVPDERIVWRSTGKKGHVDGAVSFHELAPDLTRILVVLEYHPQGLFERTGNLWRAQGRRARLELKHFVRHVMTRTVLDPDGVDGWRGEIRDGQVVRDHQTALADERADDEHDGRADKRAEQAADEHDDPGDEPDDPDGDDRDDDREPDAEPARGRSRAGAATRKDRDDDTGRSRPPRQRGNRDRAPGGDRR
ncbi:SRPBCC family protein [Polymorphospora sp. NPDC051019]|uniref:SRPBCC family protein n=1 Tax=Polymorphospora sp. NPDC051019 TaxID=3155725 RepID=UPI003447433A